MPSPPAAATPMTAARWPAMAPDPRRAGLDPVHILGICEHATTGGGPRAVIYTLARPSGITIRLASPKAARTAAAALTRVGYQAALARPRRRCRTVLVTGWNASALEARLAAMRATIQQLRGSEPATAAAAIGHYRRQPPSLPAAAATAAALTHTEHHLRAAIAARCGIHIPRDPTILPADTGNALRLRATWALEELIATLTEGHVRHARRALAQFRTLRRDGSDDWAADNAIHPAAETPSTPGRPASCDAPGTTTPPPLWPPPASAGPATPGDATGRGKPQPRPHACLDFPAPGSAALPAPAPSAPPGARAGQRTGNGQRVKRHGLGR